MSEKTSSICPPRFRWRTNSLDGQNSLWHLCMPIVSPLRMCNSINLMHYSIKPKVPYSSSMCALILVNSQRLETGLLLGGIIEKQCCDEDCASARVQKFEVISEVRSMFLCEQVNITAGWDNKAYMKSKKANWNWYFRNVNCLQMGHFGSPSSFVRLRRKYMQRGHQKVWLSENGVPPKPRLDIIWTIFFSDIIAKTLLTWSNSQNATFLAITLFYLLLTSFHVNGTPYITKSLVTDFQFKNP